MPVGIIVLLSIFYGTISAVAVLGNSLVIWIVATSRGMQNVTNYYIANLALADIVIGLFAIPFQVQAAREKVPLQGTGPPTAWNAPACRMQSSQTGAATKWDSARMRYKCVCK